MLIYITFRDGRHHRADFYVAVAESVAELKQEMSTHFYIDARLMQLQLSPCRHGRVPVIMHDSQTLAHYGVQEGSELELTLLISVFVLEENTVFSIRTLVDPDMQLWQFKIICGTLLAIPSRFMEVLEGGMILVNDNQSLRGYGICNASAVLVYDMRRGLVEVPCAASGTEPTESDSE